MRIEPCKPPVGYYHYSNPASQGALMAKTTKWPKGHLPDGCGILDAYTDRMWEWDQDKAKRASEALGARSFKDASDEQLLAFSRVWWPDYEIVAVRVVHYYNVATGYSCPRVDVIYKDVSLPENGADNG